ncbi:MAG: Lrp/AsnC family transcriptional regulator [Conexivisphaerales archaeon]
MEKKVKVSVLDNLDIDILKLLEEDCTLTYQDIAGKLNRSLWTVRDRITLLKNRGVIKKCKGILDYSLMGYDCKAILLCNIPPNHIEEAIQFMKTQEEIKGITIITGDTRFIITIIGKKCNDIRNYIKRYITKFEIYNTELNIVLEEPL